MMACLNIREMQGYLEDGRTENAEASLKLTVEIHLAVCGKCRTVFERMAATHKRVNTWLWRWFRP